MRKCVLVCMQSSHRIFHPSCSISRSCQNTHKSCKVSSFPHLSGRTHTSTTTPTPVDNIPPHSSCSSFSPDDSFPHPYPKRLFCSIRSSSGARFYSSRAGSLTRDMPANRKDKSASKEVEISKSLSYLLRHGAKNEGIQLDEAGWANVADVVGFCPFLLSCVSHMCLFCF